MLLVKINHHKTGRYLIKVIKNVQKLKQFKTTYQSKSGAAEHQ